MSCYSNLGESNPHRFPHEAVDDRVDARVRIGQREQDREHIHVSRSSEFSKD